MSTTTIRLEEELKARVVTAAERAGKMAHAFIVDAIAERVEQAELEEEFHRVADERWAKVLVVGKTVPFDEAKAYLEARARAETPRRPAAREARSLISAHGARRAAARGPRRLRPRFRSPGAVAGRRAPQRIAETLQPLQLLSHSPLIGRKVRGRQAGTRHWTERAWLRGPRSRRAQTSTLFSCGQSAASASQATSESVDPMGVRPTLISIRPPERHDQLRGDRSGQRSLSSQLFLCLPHRVRALRRAASLFEHLADESLPSSRCVDVDFTHAVPLPRRPRG